MHVAFESRNRLKQCRKDTGDPWDDEIYFVVNKLTRGFPVRGLRSPLTAPVSCPSQQNLPKTGRKTARLIFPDA